MTKPLYKIKPEDAHLHLSKGNSKIGKGIWAFSTLPGNSEHLLILNKTVLLTDILGTCSRYCTNCARDGACYAWRDAKLHHNVTIKAWAENTILLRSGKLFDELDTFINTKNKKYLKTKNLDDRIICTIRINASGEIENLEQFESWNNLAIKHPEVQFGVYTKNFDDLEKFMDKHEDTAENLVINISQWHGIANEFLSKHPGKFNIFEYDDSNKKESGLSKEEVTRIAKETHCPAVTKTGHHATDAAGNNITCDKCRRCYKKTGATTAVYSH